MLNKILGIEKHFNVFLNMLEGELLLIKMQRQKIIIV